MVRDGAVILILHPLKSELVFPTCDELDLDCSPLRWDCAIHLLDALFYGASAPRAPRASGGTRMHIYLYIMTSLIFSCAPSAF